MATVAGSLRNKVLVVDDLTSGDITVTDLVVSGTVTLQGTATTLDSTNTTITDSIIELNSGLTGSNTKDIGFVFERGSTGNNAAFIWDESADRFTVITTTGTASDNTLAGTVANFQAGSFYGNGANLTSLNGSNISSGTVAATRIASLAASKITSGTFADARISSSSVTQHLGSYLTGNQTITLSGDVSGSGTTSINVTVADDSHNHIISNVDGLQTALDGKLPLAGGTMTGELNIHKTNSAGVLNLRNTSDSSGNPVAITFSSQGTSPTQIGHIKYTHSNTLSYGALESFTIGGTESSTVILADGQFYYKDGIYKKPTTGTGAGTRKDANWDTAYGWGNHASQSYITNSTANLDANKITTGTISTNRINQPTSGNWWSGGIPIVATDGVMEIGKYIDFHNADASTSDYTARITNSGDHLYASGRLYVNSNQRVFADDYHPNADKWTTARSHTVTLTGAVTGTVSQSVDGTAAKTWTIATTATADPTLTLAGDVTGSATFTNLGNATLTATVANNSHTHNNLTNYVLKAGDTMTGNLVVNANVQHQGLTMTAGTDIDQIYTAAKTLTITTSFADTGIDAADLATGTYLVQLQCSDSGVGGAYHMTYSGVMSWVNMDTNDTAVDEIVLHRAGHASIGKNLFLRVQYTVTADTNNLKLQIRGNYNATGSSTYTFKFRRMI